MSHKPDKDASDVNREYYDRFAATEQPYWKYMAAPRARVRRLRSLAGKLSPEAICDFGCGNGALLMEIRRDHPQARLFGIDLSEAQTARNRAAHPEITWIQADISRPLKAGLLPVRPFLGLSSEVIEHLDRPDTYLSNIHKALAPGGTLLVSTQSGPIRQTERHVGHIKHYTAHEMKSMMEKAGFEKVAAWNEGFPFHDLSKYLANRNPEKTIKQFEVAHYGFYQRLICAGLCFLFHFNVRTRGAQLFAVAAKADAEQSK